jgi:hypothetical protein
MPDSPRQRPRVIAMRACGGSLSTVLCWQIRVCVVTLCATGCADSEAQDTSSSDTSTSALAPVCESAGWDEAGDEGAEDTTIGIGDDMPLPFTIGQVQHGAALDGTRIVITGVIAVTPSAVSEVLYGHELFVQDPMGGPWSGLRLVADAGDPAVVLAPGDSANVVGEVVMHDGFVALEVDIGDLERTGAPGLPAPTIVALDELDPESASARQYEGVVVQIAGATVTQAEPCVGELVLDDLVRVDDRFVPGQLAGVSEGAELSSVRGVFVRAVESYELAPPDAASLQ